MTPEVSVNSAVLDEAATRLRGGRLVLARTVWLVVSLLAVGLFAASVPLFYLHLHTVCAGPACDSRQLTPERIRELYASGLSLTFYSAYYTTRVVGNAFVWFGLAAVLFWRKSADRGALSITFLLVLAGAGITGIVDMLAAIGTPWGLVGDLLGGLGFVSFFVLLYLFPDGRFVPRWTRWLAVAAIVEVIANVFVPGSPIDLWAHGLGGLYFLGLVFSGIFAQVYRYLRISGPVQRQQTKWVVFGVAAGLGTTLAIGVLRRFVPSVERPGLVASLVLDLVADTMPVLTIPLSIGLAILRYRLWDIDIIIRRTLIYGLLTVTLGLVYLGSVVLIQQFFRTLTGQGNNQLPVVASTLAVAALFNPLRQRIQASIDRRFFRRKYDLTKTLQAFSATLRDEVELNRLSSQLLAVIEETMQPAHASLWLRDAPSQRSGTPQRPDRRSGEMTVTP